MRCYKKIYSRSLILLTLVYLNFFFFAPYVHFHQEIEATLEGNSILHSHLPGHSKTGAAGIYSAENHLHSHNLHFSTFLTIITTRNFISSVECNLSAVIFSLFTPDKEKTFGIATEESFKSTSLDKYVFSAGNSSPPKS